MRGGKRRMLKSKMRIMFRTRSRRRRRNSQD